MWSGTQCKDAAADGYACDGEEDVTSTCVCPPTQVANSDYEADGSIDVAYGTPVTVTCDDGYQRDLTSSDVTCNGVQFVRTLSLSLSLFRSARAFHSIPWS